MWTAADFGWGEFARANALPPPQTGLMTFEKLYALIEAGHGQGHFQRYKPWLRVTKRDLSPNSVIGHLPAPTLGRTHHYRSIAEKETIHIAKWLGAIDVRDQFPAWPWMHQHPGVGLPGFDGTSKLRGLISISKEAGVEHGNYIGTKIPYVATIDILTTWISPDKKHYLIALQNKPEKISKSPEPNTRPKQRLEIIRRYCIESDITHRIIHAEKFPRELPVNLEFLEPNLRTQEIQSIANSHLYKRVLHELKINGYSDPPQKIINYVASRNKSQLNILFKLLHLALWRTDIDHDLTLPYRPCDPLTKGGENFLHDLRGAWGVLQ